MVSNHILYYHLKPPHPDRLSRWGNYPFYNIILSPFSHIEQCNGPRSRMGADGRTYRTDQKVFNTESFLNQTGYIFCLFQRIPMTDKYDVILIPIAADGPLHIIYKGIQGLLSPTHFSDWNQSAFITDMKNWFYMNQCSGDSRQL